jgi:hypothetical protein
MLGERSSRSRLALLGAVLLGSFVIGFAVAGAVAVSGSTSRVEHTSDGRSVVVGESWPGALDDCVTDADQAVLPNCYREAVAVDSFVKQPASTYSTLAFCAVGLGILAMVDRARRRGILGPLLRQEEAWLGFVALGMGPGSALFHGTLTAWGGWFDQLSMYALLSFIVACDVVRVRRSPPRLSTLFWGLFAISCVLKAVTGSAGTYVFIAAGIGTGVFSVVSWRRLLPAVGLRRDGRRLVLALTVLGAAIVPWLLSNPSSGNPTTTPYHAAWHVLSAAFVGAYWWYLRSEEAIAPAPATPREAATLRS